jgi:hypothetical protein
MSVDETDSVPAEAVRHSDVIQDPDSGKWITVTRIVNGNVKATDIRGDETVTSAEQIWTFYGDERLDETVTLHGERPTVFRRRPSEAIPP